MAERREKLVSLSEIADLFRSGMKIAIGGLLFHNKPMTIIREIVKAGVKDLTIYSSPLSSIDADILIGAGAAKELFLPHVSFGHLGFAPNYRRAVEKGKVKVNLCDEAILCGGFLAASEGIPYHPVVSLKGTDILKFCKGVKVFRSNDGESIACVPAISPDVAIIHAQEGDKFGNLRHTVAVYADRLMAEASRFVVASVDRIISNELVRKEPFRTTVPSYLVDVVVEVPYGAHPCSSMGLYLHDEEHLREYLNFSKTEDGFMRYLEKYVYGVQEEEDYIKAVGGLKRLESLNLGKWN